ncbi:MAG: DUF1501 domain-containing protein [Acidobacteria bacterium]|nr:DUF1501 domain-containing protein [Acidobacteriota bacterium]
MRSSDRQHLRANPAGKARQFSRRDFFSSFADGLHASALAYLFGIDLIAPGSVKAASSESGIAYLRAKRPHFSPKAKSVIHLFMNGGPSQVDLFDPKPILKKYEGQPPSRELANDIEFIEQAGGMMPSPFKFSKCGQSGIEVSELLPHLSQQVDEITLIRSMFTTHFNHEPAVYMMQTGRLFTGHPSLGSWVVYGLGTENQNLPAYVVLDDPKGLPVNGIQNWQSGWLPPVYQGIRMRSEGSPLLNLKPQNEFPDPISELARSIVQRLDNSHRAARPGNPELDARIASYELAARMQMSATDALDISQESAATQEMYGLNNDVTASYGRRCLMARRLVERGVRFVQIFIESQIWDNHSNLKTELGACCAKTDQPAAALLKDLKQRGLLDSTLVIWGGEFGRLPLSQMRTMNAGRDHGPGGFSSWLAGGGVKKGHVHGATDEIGYKAVVDPVSPHDFHATLLHLLGMNHEKLVFNHNGLNERLSGVEPARIVEGILA